MKPGRRVAWLGAALCLGCTVVIGDDGTAGGDVSTSGDASTSGSPTGTGTTSDDPDTTHASTTALPTSAGDTGETTATPADCAPGRAELDRPDDHPDAYQVHVNYVLPQDGADGELDLDGRIATSVASFSAWFADQADGRQLRLDTCDGALDIRFIRLARTEADLRSEGVYLRDAIEAELQANGQLADNKLELVYYDGDADATCGGGPFPPGLVGRVGALYLRGTFTDPNIPPCASNPVGADQGQPGYFDFAALHELLHALGMAPLCAPHSVLQGHVSDSPMDLMYAGGEPWDPQVLDIGRDDYLDHGDPACPDLARSVFLEPLPAAAELPPGW